MDFSIGTRRQMTQSAGLKHTTGTKEEENFVLLAFICLVVRSFVRSMSKASSYQLVLYKCFGAKEGEEVN